MDPRNRDKLAEGLARNQHEALRQLVNSKLYPDAFVREEMDVPWEKLPMQVRDMMTAVTAMTVIDQLKLTPCHVTGMHTPDHHQGIREGGEWVGNGYTCNLQAQAALQSFIVSVGGENQNDLPRDLHDEDCGWCHDLTIYKDKRGQDKLRRSWAWAGRKLRFPRRLVAR